MRRARADGMPRVVHVISGLGVGGAETMLAKLVEAEAAAGVRRSIEVIALGPDGPLAPRIRAAGVGVTALGLRPGAMRALPGVFVALCRRLAALAPDVVQCWLYHGDLLGGLAARFAIPRARRLWSIRTSEMPHPASAQVRVVIRACAALSRWLPHRVISCSAAAAALHVRYGYSAELITVIPNGFDLGRFRPDPQAYLDVRTELGLASGTPIIGCIARFDPQKDFPTLLAAWGNVADARPDVAFVLAGRGLEPGNDELVAMTPSSLRGRLYALGVRRDVPRVTAAFDVATLASAYGEGFPNVLGEALACGVPCVATDVGDSREIIGNDGHVVAIRDVPALAAGILALLALPEFERRAIGTRARVRVQGAFDIVQVARRYWEVQGVNA
jgi:glycosyltransferase involved in cell wall biosynthesis